MLTRKKMAYLPHDRAVAVIEQTTLPEEQTGTALFADISGFSKLAQELRYQLGNTAGAEMLIEHLNKVFTVLIDAIHQYRGSVISFSGDALTCWFDDKQLGDTNITAQSALMAANNMQHALSQMASIVLPDESNIQLNIKITLATGTISRWILGAPDIQLIDTILGAPINRLSTAEAMAVAGDIILDERTHTATASFVSVLDTMQHEKHIFRRIRLDIPCAEPNPWDAINDITANEDVFMQWVLPVVDSHLEANVVDLTELRMVIALFMRFELYDDIKDPPYTIMNRFVHWVQRIINQYGGNVLQLTFGDKGQYLYGVFGAPISYDNNASRALEAATELQFPPDDLPFRTQIGVSTGLMRVGTYGSPRRHTYGVQGDEVNIAARLMMHSGLGDVLVSEFVIQQTEGLFSYTDLHEVTVKGQSDPIVVGKLEGKTNRSTSTLAMPRIDKNSMIGREREWMQLHSALSTYLKHDEAQLIILQGETGVGKTYLAAAVRKTIEQSYDCTWFTASCDDILVLPFAPYRFIFQRYYESYQRKTKSDDDAFSLMYQDLIFTVQTSPRLSDQMRNRMEEALSRYQNLLRTVVAFETVANRSIGFSTMNFSKLRIAMVWFLRAISLRERIIIQIQNSHAMDQDSFALTEMLFEYNDDFPVAIILSSRPNEVFLDTFSISNRIAVLNIVLKRLSRRHTQDVVRALLGKDVDTDITNVIHNQSSGNSLYIHLLTLDLKEQNLIYEDDTGWHFVQEMNDTEIPLALQEHIVTRIDRLGLRAKTVIQAGAVLGFVFDSRLLRRIVEDDDDLQATIDLCEWHNVWKRVSDTLYEFNNSLFHSVAYAMLGTQRQVTLHNLAIQALAELTPVTYINLIKIRVHRNAMDTLKGDTDVSAE
ncbi:MAG: adenylate/guanylate cyclase domain-containing protein [Chloroflexota bacterium]